MHIQHLKRDTLALYMNLLGMFVFFVLTFFWRNSYSAGAIVMALAGVITIRFRHFYLPRILWQWEAVLLLMVGVGILLRIFYQSSLRDYDHLQPFLFSTLLLPSFYYARPSWMSFVRLLAVSSVLSLAVAIYTRIILKEAVGSNFGIGYQHHIQFSNISMLLAGGNIIVFFSSLKQQRCYGSLLAALCGILAAFLGGGRGSWLIFPVIVLVSIFVLPKKYRLLAGSALIMGMIALCVILYFIPETAVASRIASLFRDLEEITQGNVLNSQGGRIEMWQCGLEMWVRNPLVGVGDQGFEVLMQELIRAQVCHPLIDIFGYNQLHNDYIDTLARLGLVGFVVLMILYLFPLYQYLKALKTADLDWRGRTCAWIGIVVVLAFMIAGLTNGFLRHNIARMFFVVLQAWCLSGIVVYRQSVFSK